MTKLQIERILNKSSNATPTRDDSVEKFAIQSKSFPIVLICFFSLNETSGSSLLFLKSSWYLFANMFTLCLIEKKKHKSVKKWRVKTEKLGVDEREFKRDKILKLKLLDG